MLPTVDPTILVSKMGSISEIIESMYSSVEALKLTLLNDNILTKTIFIPKQIEGYIPQITSVRTLFNNVKNIDWKNTRHAVDNVLMVIQEASAINLTEFQVRQITDHALGYINTVLSLNISTVETQQKILDNIISNIKNIVPGFNESQISQVVDSVKKSINSIILEPLLNGDKALKELNNLIPLSISTADVSEKMKELVNKIPTVNADSIISDVKSKGVNIAKDMLSPPCGKIKPGGKSFITMLLEKLTSMLNNLAEMAINFVTKMVTNAINGAFDMIGNMRKLVIDIKNAISNILKNAKEELSKKIVGIVKGIYKELEEKYRQIVKIIEDVATFMEKEYNATIDKIEQYSEFVRCLVRTDTDIATL